MERSAQGVVLETGGLVLRQFTLSDAGSLAGLGADPDVMRFITGGLATSRDEIKNDVLPGSWPGTGVRGIRLLGGRGEPAGNFVG